MSKQKNKGGRPTKITLEIVERVVDRINRGLTVAEACILEDGISPHSFMSCVQKGRKFANHYARAKAGRLDNWTKRIEVEGSKGASGVIFLLERCHRDRFGQKASDVNINNQVAVLGMSQQELEQFRAAVKRAYVDTAPKKEIEV